MSNIQLYILAGLPTTAILSSLVISVVQMSALRGDIRAQYGALRKDRHSEFDTLREEIHELRADIKLVTGKVYELMGQK